MSIMVCDDHLHVHKAMEKGSGAFRFWTDARRFKAAEDKCLLQSALFASGGIRTGGWPKASPIPGPLGYQRPSDWDFLWSPARLALKSLPLVREGQLVSAFPGLMSLTKKRELSLTLKAALGEEEAFQIMPRTYSLPDEMGQLRQFLAQDTFPSSSPLNSATVPTSSASASASSPSSSDLPPLWILKTAQHLGAGLKLLPADQILEEAESRRKAAAAAVKVTVPLRPHSKPKVKPYVQAQQYISNPLLLSEGRKFGIRVWVLITGFDPLRVYLHSKGLVLFSTDAYSNETWAPREGAGGAGKGHVTNYAQNVDGLVWDLEKLEKVLGGEKYEALWRKIKRSTALTFSAALPHIRWAHEAVGTLMRTSSASMGSQRPSVSSLNPNPPRDCMFELLGLDYLVDENMHPWLLEVNGTPSLAVEHEDLSVQALIHEQKASMVNDMVKILRIPTRFEAKYAGIRRQQVDGSEEDGDRDDDEDVSLLASSSAVNNDVASSSTRDASSDSGGSKRGVKRSVAAGGSIKQGGDWQKVVKEELDARGGFQPLMGHFNMNTSSSIEWHPSDHELARLVKQMGREVRRASK